MRKFKLHTGVSNPYEINVDSACDNSIQLIGLYKRLENTDRSYGKYYNRSLSFAPYNETAYCFCPYSSNSREVIKESWKKELTDYERNIYNVVREYFDLAVYIV